MVGEEIFFEEGLAPLLDTPLGEKGYTSAYAIMDNKKGRGILSHGLCF
jgi:hypothetical protein